MFSKHPNGLIAAALANMGERFGFSFYIGILQCWVFHLAGQFGQSVADEGA